MNDAATNTKRDSDPLINDSDRSGDDLLARMDELTATIKWGDFNGWRPLMKSAANEIRRLRRQLREIASDINEREDRRTW